MARNDREDKISEYVWHEIVSALNDLNIKSIVGINANRRTITIALDPTWLKEQVNEPTAKGLEEYLENEQ